MNPLSGTHFFNDLSNSNMSSRSEIPLCFYFSCKLRTLILQYPWGKCYFPYFTNGTPRLPIVTGPSRTLKLQVALLTAGGWPAFWGVVFMAGQQPRRVLGRLCSQTGRAPPVSVTRPNPFPHFPNANIQEQLTRVLSELIVPQMIPSTLPFIEWWRLESLPRKRNPLGFLTLQDNWQENKKSLMWSWFISTLVWGLQSDMLV